MPGVAYLVPGIAHLVLHTWYQVLGIAYLVLHTSLPFGGVSYLVIIAALKNVRRFLAEGGDARKKCHSRTNTAVRQPVIMMPAAVVSENMNLSYENDTDCFGMILV